MRLDAAIDAARPPGPEPDPVLRVAGLTTEFRIGGSWHAAVRDVSFDLARNETLALVGESGCGKSMTALSIMRLVPAAGGRVAAGRVLLDGRDLLAIDEEAMRQVRGNRVAMIFQEPMTSLNPVLQVGFQIAESLRYHRGMDQTAANQAALALMDEVRMPAARERFNDYPHQFSGGMRQRVMVAIALACNPSVLLADEPTTALDVTIQAQVLSLLADIKKAHGMAVVFITHNLGVVAAISDRVAVMYAGEIVELTTTAELFRKPSHPYTELLLASIPRVDRDAGDLQTIRGQVPPINRMPAGCRFAPRCPIREDRCAAMHPQLMPLAGDAAHQVRCLVRAPGGTGA